MTMDEQRAPGAKRLRTDAQKAALGMGVVFLLVGIFGFVPGITTNYQSMTFAGHESDALLLGYFQVSILHNIVHLLFGVGGLVMSRIPSQAKTFLLGGGVFALYPVAVSHAADRAPVETLVPMIQGMLLINSLGSAMSPLLISPAMNAHGETGLFWAFALVNLAMVTFFFWRRGKRPVPANPAPFAAAATFSPTGAELRVTEDLRQAAQEHPPMVDALSGEASPPTGSRYEAS